MKIAIVGGGSRCLYLMNFLERHDFQLFVPQILAVADLKDDAVGLVEAKKRGMFVTNDYNDFFELDNIDLIAELTGDMDIYNDILIKKNKNVRAVSNQTALLFWEVARVSKIAQDAKNKLYQTEKIYEVMINDLLQEEAMVIKTDYRITDINDYMLEKLGLKRDEAIGKFCYEIMHHQDTPCSGDEHPCPLTKTLETGEPSSTTHIHLDKDGNELCYAISCYPFRENGKISGVVEMSRDITKQIKTQKSLMQQEKLMSIGRLSAGIAHEINNPLTTIMTSSMLLQEDLDPDDDMYAELETISKESLRCRKIVQSLLDFARQTKPMKKLLNLNDVITDSLYLIRKQAKFHDITINTALSEGLPQTYIDKDQIQQTLINLTLNAIEATESGGLVTFTTEYYHSGDMIHVKVSDTGKGISKDNLNKIFDPFFTTNDSGTGLGLAITHGIIEQHGGEIQVDSIMGEGTTFTIMLPVKQKGKNGS